MAMSFCPQCERPKPCINVFIRPFDVEGPALFIVCEGCETAPHGYRYIGDHLSVNDLIKSMLHHREKTWYSAEHDAAYLEAIVYASWSTLPTHEQAKLYAMPVE